MFTGIIEEVGKVVHTEKDNSNLHISIQAMMTTELRIDQSIAHNGVCLTVIDIQNNVYRVTAIEETLNKSNLHAIKTGDFINLERAMKLGDRLDGHIVQGHIDQTAKCIGIKEANGSWLYTFQYSANLGNITIEKGSITVNGVSLTVVNSQKDQFSVAIIPYTYHHTNFSRLKVNDDVNLEFDVIGKYVKRLTEIS